MDDLERIFALIRERGIEQKEFANLIGVSEKVVSAWSTRRSKSYKKMLPEIASALDTTLLYLSYGEKETPIVQDDGLTEKERDLIERFRKLPPDRQQYVLGVTQAAADMQ